MEFNPGDIVYYEPDFDELQSFVERDRSIDTECVVIHSDDSSPHMVRLRGWRITQRHAACILPSEYGEWYHAQRDATNAAIAKYVRSMTDDLALLAEAERKVAEATK